jgi:hypothetical protein
MSMSMSMRNIFPGLVVGLIFGAGLALSDMINPARVLNFLDLAGSWDPSLAFVMGGALIPSAIASSRKGCLPVPQCSVPVGALRGFAQARPLRDSHSACGNHGCSWQRCSPACSSTASRRSRASRKARPRFMEAIDGDGLGRAPPPNS